MKIKVFLPLLLGLSLGFIHSSAQEPQKRSNPQELVPQLGHHDYLNREQANLTLWNLGDEALPLLEENQEHSNPEIRLRIKQLITDIQFGILPDTPEETKKLIREYATASASKKAVTITKLHKLKLHEQIIRLYLIEKDEKVHQNIAKQAKQSLQLLVKDLLTKDKTDHAITLLKRYQKIEGSTALLAKLLLKKGTLSAELKAEKDPVLRLAYARLLGDLPLVRQLATQLEDQKLLATLAILDGNILPYLEFKQAQHKSLESNNANGFQLMAHRLRNETQEADKLALLLAESLSEEGTDDALKALFSNGYVNLALPKMAEHYPAEKLAFAELSGNWKEFLAPYKLTPGQPITDDWIAQQSAPIIKRLPKSNSQNNDHYLLIVFLQSQNELTESSRLLKPLLNHILSLNSPEITEEFLKELINLNLLPTLLQTLDEDTLLHAPSATTLLTTFISQDFDEELLLAQSLDQIHPQQSRLKKLTTLAQCFGALTPPLADYEKTTQELLKHLDKNLPPNEQVTYLKTIYLSALINGHLKLALTTLDQLINITAPDDNNPEQPAQEDEENQQNQLVWIEAKLAILSNLGEWKGMLTLLKAHPSLLTGSPQKIARHAMIHQRLGNAKKARVLLDQSTKLATSELKSSAAILSTITNFSALDTAHPYLVQNILSAPLDSSEWSVAFYHLRIHAKQHQNWKQASAISHLFASRYMESYQSYKNLYSAWEKNMEADTYLAAALTQEGKSDQAIALLQRNYDNSPGKIQLADVFFPITRTAGLTTQHDQWYEDAIAQQIKQTQTYPKSHNHKNSLAWLSSCAQLNLDQAETWVAQAIKAQPQNYAYLHTMAEVHHAKGNHDKAIEWCTKALHHGANSSAQMRDELDRFKKAATRAPLTFPKLEPAE